VEIWGAIEILLRYAIDKFIGCNLFVVRCFFFSLAILVRFLAENRTSIESAIESADAVFDWSFLYYTKSYVRRQKNALRTIQKKKKETT
jgi:hypothetical protein